MALWGACVGAIPATDTVEKFVEPVLVSTSDDVAVKLASIGYKADDIVKLKVAGVL